MIQAFNARYQAMMQQNRPHISYFGTKFTSGSLSSAKPNEDEPLNHAPSIFGRQPLKACSLPSGNLKIRVILRRGALHSWSASAQREIKHPSYINNKNVNLIISHPFTPFPPSRREQCDCNTFIGKENRTAPSERYSLHHRWFAQPVPPQLSPSV